MKPREQRNGDRLDEAIVVLIQNQASFLAQLTESNRENEKRFAENEKRLGKIEKHFDKLERDMKSIKAMLLRHERLLMELPEAVRQKIGFQHS